MASWWILLAACLSAINIVPLHLLHLSIWSKLLLYFHHAVDYPIILLTWRGVWNHLEEGVYGILYKMGASIECELCLIIYSGKCIQMWCFQKPSITNIPSELYNAVNLISDTTSEFLKSISDPKSHGPSECVLYEQQESGFTP